jgi:hypothetical protein
MSTRAKKDGRLKTSTPTYVFAKLACERAFERPELPSFTVLFSSRKTERDLVVQESREEHETHHYQVSRIRLQSRVTLRSS